MKKLTISIALATLFLGITQSCKKENIISKKEAKPKVEKVENNNVATNQELIKENLEISKPSSKPEVLSSINVNCTFNRLTTLPNNKSYFNGYQIVETRQMDGVYEGDPYSIIISSLNNGDIAYDIDKDGIYDYGLHPETPDFSQVTILDDINNLIGNASIVYKPNLSPNVAWETNTNSGNNVSTVAQVRFNRITEKSMNVSNNDILAAPKPTGRSCFEATTGSMEGTIATFIAGGLTGFWGAAAFYGGIYARCASKYGW
jgi:hypothetical protein